MTDASKLAESFGIESHMLSNSFEKICKNVAAVFVKAQQLSSTQAEKYIKDRRVKIANDARKAILDSLDSSESDKGKLFFCSFFL